MELEQSFIALIEQSIKANWYLNALTDYKGATLQYRDVARKIEKIHIMLENAGIVQGDKIAICGRNSAHWTVTFLAVMTYGGVVVPIYMNSSPIKCIILSTIRKHGCFCGRSSVGKPE